MPGKSSLHESGEGQRVIALESWEGLGPQDAFKKDSRGLSCNGSFGSGPGPLLPKALGSPRTPTRARTGAPPPPLLRRPPPGRGRLMGFLELRRQCGVSHEI